MNTLKKLYYFTYVIVAIVVVGILFFNVNLEEMLGVDGMVSFWIVVSLLLLAMLTVGVIGDYVETRSLSKRVDKMTKENVALKAQLYEKMHPAGEASSDPTTTAQSSWLSKLGFSGKSDLSNRRETDN